MLTNLGFLNVGKKWPPSNREEIMRLQDYSKQT